MGSIVILAQSGGEAALSRLDTVQTILTPALIAALIGLFLYMFKDLRRYVEKLSDRIDARFDDQGARIDARFDDQGKRIDAQGARIDAQAKWIEARFDESRRLQNDTNLRISALDGRVARIEGGFEILLAGGGFKPVGASAAAIYTPPTESSEAASVESSAEKAASVEKAAPAEKAASSAKDSAEDVETTPNESELDPLPSPA